MSDETLRVLGDRYEIHQRLARGGMAQVYLARDRSLDRPVAVKELVPEFATDPSFVERFRREAQAAANLAHPNIVGVYDWGTQDGTYYIVMEYVDGPSLSQVIRRDGPLHPRRAAEVADEVAAALGFAHSRGVVHRDVKPGNVLLTGNGQSKVTDFGIARAMTSSDEDLTQAGSVMGTATYFSPEQAQGLPVDPRSDLYSLGVVLYEMVTGRPPFSGDTPLAIAYKHVQDQPAPPSSVIPDLPAGLEAVIMKLLQKRPEDRYASAEELRADLKRFLAGEDTLALLAGGMGAAAAAAGAAAMAADNAATTVQPQVTGAVPPTYPDHGEDESEEDHPKSRTGVFLAVVIVLLLLLAGGLFWLANNLSGEQVTVPDVIGLTREEATRALEKEGFEVKVTERASELEPGTVVDQDPAGEDEADKGSTVEIFVSSGAEQVKVPDVVGMTAEDATTALENEGFTVKAKPVASDQVDAGSVAGQTPAAGEQAPKGSEVEIQVSLGPAKETVPDVTGQTLAAAQAAIQNAGFKVGGPVQQSSDTVEAGRVISTDPPGGSAAEQGQTVTITVSTGPEQVSVPNVVGQTESDATAAIRARGLEPSVSTQSVPAGSSDVGRVISQNPSGGTKANTGSTVKIVVGVASATTTTTSSTTTTTSP